jgi:hypothetical protein
MSVISKPYSEVFSPVRNNAPKFQLQWRSALKTGAVQNWLKDATKKHFILTEFKKIQKRWNRCFEVEGDYVEK